MKFSVHVNGQISHKEFESFALRESECFDKFPIQYYLGRSDYQPCHCHIGQQGEVILGGIFLQSLRAMIYYDQQSL